MQMHYTLATRGRRVLGDPEAWARRLAATFGTALVLFCVVDDHVHLVLTGDRQVLGHAVSGVSRWSPVPLQPAWAAPVEGRRHLERLVRYLARQPDKHGLGVPAALYAGSCFADLVGARRLAEFDGRRLFELLPRWRERDVWRQLDLQPPGALSDQQIRTLGAWRLSAAAAASFGCTTLVGFRRAHVAMARRAAVQLGLAVGLPASQMAEALQTTPRSVRRMSVGDAAPVQVVRNRLALEELVGTRSPMAPPRAMASTGAR